MTTEPILLKTFHTEEIQPPERQEIIELCTRSFSGEDFSPLFRYIPSGVNVLAYLNDELVSHAVFSTRWMQVNDGPLLRCAYVDAVATLPEHWRKGYGAAVMRRLAVEMAAAQYEIGGLSTSTPAFYESTGWERWLGPLAGRTEDGLVFTNEEDAVMVLRLPLTPPFDRSTDRLSIEKSGRIW